VLLGGLVLISTALRFWAAVLVPVPWIAPDEFVYGELGRSLWKSGHFEILGEPVRFYTLVYPALAGLPLSLPDRELGYDLLKALQALAMSLAAVPAYLWARSLVARRWALTAAALTVAVPGLAYSGLVMTEVAFYPIALLASWALARALERPTAVRQALLVAAVLAAAATRLQALVLLPVVATAVVVAAALARERRLVVRLLPTLGALAVLFLAWSAYQLREGGPATDVLGAYRAAGEDTYDIPDAARFVLWHAGDALLLTGVFPVCAVAILVWRAAARREPDARVRAYLATAVSLAVWLVLEVGVFASRHVGRLAERDLLALAPVLFVGFALWLGRGAPRPRLATLVTAVVALALLLELPMRKLATHAALPDAFTIIPLWRLSVRWPSVNLELVFDALAVLAVAVFVLVPRRRVALLPVLLLAVLALTSLSTGRVVAAQATIVRVQTSGPSRDWIDRATPPGARVAHLYGGEIFWNAVWQGLFWNDRVRAVYDLLDARIPGALPQPSVGPLADGRLVDAQLRPLRERYVTAASHVTFRGRRIAEAPTADLFLWRADPPLRLDALTRTLTPPDGRGVDSETRAYDCRGGRLRLTLVAGEQTDVRLRRNGALTRLLHLAPGETWKGSIAAPRGASGGVCTFDVLSPGRVELRLVRYER
jgi:hypothetical protein